MAALPAEGSPGVRLVPAVPAPRSSSPVTDEDIQELIKDIQEDARDLLRALPQCDAEEPLRRIAQMQAQMDGLTAGLVGRARHHRLTWGRVGRTLNISEDTARHRYTDAHIQRQLARFTRPRSAPLPTYTPNTEASGAEEPASDDPSTPREPSGAAFNRLAPVLSMLARASQLPLKDLSSRTRCSASYLSRVLSGERTPTWTLTERFARACGADPSVLRTVWESERLREKEPVSLPEDASLPAGARLLNALNTLHVRAGRPTPYDISVASRWRLAVEEVAPVLEGAQIPSWPLLSRLLHVLGGDPDYFKPLWEKASAEHRHLPRHLHTRTPAKTPEAAAKLDGVLTKFGEALAQDDESLRESQRARLLERHAERALNPTSRRTTSLKQQPR
ncbi:helix-turn-helix domain-containing protein [Streptomyces sp. NBC_00724]|uniref:helix-turn-helix domain-containing protein n=1 Tax=Streptomyces sp. NBC_00724 TaxID=2975812 RepID=UPI002ED5899E|nr:helix-turn-helix domain-containing protein [Streptomyces sp. NBC_00724]WTI92114.1 helix-turn-helix domain-containing protein [Streptomyces sp. NBC_00724]